MGGDPERGAQKFLGIQFINPALNDGKPLVLACAEGGRIDLATPTAATLISEYKATKSKVQIITAIYGTPKRGNDVRAICQAMVNHGNYTFAANNQVFGPDPDVGIGKSFTLFAIADKTKAILLGCREGQSLTLPI